jgi:hypothetical protein
MSIVVKVYPKIQLPDLPRLILLPGMTAPCAIYNMRSFFLPVPLVIV